MQVFIGGACAGKRDAVATRFPQARWARAGEFVVNPSQARAQPQTQQTPGDALVVGGWLDEIERRIERHELEHEADDDALRAALAFELDGLLALECQLGTEVIVILDEVGRGIVPMAPEARRLRDLAGWLAQDAVKRAEQVWYVRHGLVWLLNSGNPPG